MRCHTLVSKSLRRVSLVQRTRRQARCLLQLLLGICCTPHWTDKYGIRPFFGGSGYRTQAHTRPAWPKIPSAPSAFPLLGAPQVLGNKPNAPEGGKSLGRGRPPEAEGNLQLPRHTRPDPCRSKHGRSKCDPTTGEAQCYNSCCSVFVARPTERASVA